MSGTSIRRPAYGFAARIAITLFVSVLDVSGVVAQQSAQFASKENNASAIQIVGSGHVLAFGGEAAIPEAPESRVDLSGDLYQVLTRGYEVLSDEDYPAARLYFRRAVELESNRSDLWLQLGYIELNLDNKEAAIEAMKRAYELDPTNNLVPHQIGYIQQQLGNNRAAAASFYRATTGTDAERGRTACRDFSVTRRLSDRLLDPPYFIDVYAVPEYLSNYDVGVFQGDVKIGRTFDGESQVEVYAGARITRDTKSTFTNLGPQYIFDNYGLIYGGARVRPVKTLPVSLFIDGGWAYDIIEQGRSPGRADFRGGAVAFREWNIGLDCNAENPFHNRWIADFYGDAIYYSRYSNMIAFGRFRPGYRFYDSTDKSAELYLLTQASWDVEDVVGNRYFDIGVGAALRLYTDIPLVFRVEFAHRDIIGGIDYTDLRFRIEYAARF